VKKRRSVFWRSVRTRAAVLYKPNTSFVIEEIDLAPPRAGEVLVQMAAAGVCHTDWHLVTGAIRHPVPVVPGHEGAGIVLAVGGGVKRLRPGEHVALNWAPNCGRCFYCLNQKPNLCSSYRAPLRQGTLLDGTTRLSRPGEAIYHFCGLSCFAEHVVVSQESCVKLPEEVPLPVAALIGCAVTTGVGSVLNTAKVRPGSSVAVFGAGGTGLCIIMAAVLAGAGRIIAVDRVEAKQEMARAFGATDTLPAGPQAPEMIRALTNGRGADYVFEVVGLSALQEQCLAAARPGGMVILVGVTPADSTTNFPGALLTRQEKSVAGCYYGSAWPPRDFPLYADLYLKGKLDLDRLISRSYNLDQINQAYTDLLTGQLARGVILLGGRD
jgi:S-(hydroxymethyl)glutathione dehydrogenase / alcohol dehydrogenase